VNGSRTTLYDGDEPGEEEGGGEEENERATGGAVQEIVRDTTFGGDE